MLQISGVLDLPPSPETSGPSEHQNVVEDHLGQRNGMLRLYAPCRFDLIAISAQLEHARPF